MDETNTQLVLSIGFNECFILGQMPRSMHIKTICCNSKRWYHTASNIAAPDTLSQPFLHQPLQPEYLNCEESAHKHSATGFDSMALDPEGRWCNRLRCWTFRNWRRIWFSDKSRFLLQTYGYIGTGMNVSLPLVFRKWKASVEVVS